VIKVGCCGYPVSRHEYGETFRLVEVDRTFYKYPRLSTVVRWREEAPEDFECTVKAHQEISHGHRMMLEHAREPFERMKEICRLLNSRILLIQSPASFRPDSLEEAVRFFEGIDRDGMTLVWETRGPLWETAEVRARLGTVLERLDIPHVTDPFKVMPVQAGPLAYFRLHGLGERMYYYQYTDEELSELCNLIMPLHAPNRGIYVLFNNLSMFEDARRFLSFISRGKFPSLTGAKGVESVRTVVSKTRFPLSRSMLMRKLGWRLAELEDGRQARLREILKHLPSKTYGSAEDLLKEMKLLTSGAVAC